MARILQKSMPIRSTLLAGMLAFAPSCFVYSQAAPANPAPSAQQPPSSPNAQQPDRSTKPAQQAEPSTPATPEEIRQAQIEADTKLLYQLSAELRAEVAKTYKESLSVTVLKKAQELEKLAKKLKAEMHLEVAASKQ